MPGWFTFILGQDSPTHDSLPTININLDIALPSETLVGARQHLDDLGAVGLYCLNVCVHRAGLLASWVCHLTLNQGLALGRALCFV